MNTKKDPAEGREGGAIEPLLGFARWTMMFLLPIVAFLLVEAYWHDPFAEVRPEARLFNILIYELITWILFFVTGRAKWALRILWLLCLVYGLTNYYVMEFRSTPFVPWDLFSVGTAASVAGNYDFTPSPEVAVLSVVFVIGIILEGFVDIRLPGVRPRGRSLWSRLLSMVRRRTGRRGEEPAAPEVSGKEEAPAGTPLWRRFLWLWRFVPALCLFLILSAFAGQLQKEEFQLEHNLYPFLFTPSVMNKYNGFAVTFAMDLAYVVVEKPEGYSASRERERMEELDKEAAKAPVPEKKELPHIIVIMNEAFSDLGVLGGSFRTEPDCMPFVHSLQQGQKNTITGLLNVSVCGGNTANTEFEFLTGNSMAFLPTGSIPYQQYVKEKLPSLASHLRELGYDTTAVHPYNASGWNRDTVYPLLGFDRFDSLREFSGVSYFRSYVTDASDYEKIKEIYREGRENGPQFIFNVTMQNHGSYTDLYENFTPDVSSNAGANVALDQYLSLVRQSDLAFRELVEYFAQEEDKTVLVFFGDHQPADAVARPVWAANGVNDQSLTKEQRALRYQVPYVVWANFPMEDGTGQDTSVNLLAQRVLRAVGVPLDGYETYLAGLEKKVPFISAVRREGDEDEIGAYQRLQYYRMFDREEE